ncbi:MAG: type I 3-dehydroquinate dehydratase [Haloferacaceae archaeon]
MAADLAFDSFTLAASLSDLGDEPAARAHADAVEFRMDLASDPLDALAGYDGRLPLIATNRAAWEGGEAADDGRLAALRAAAERDAVAAVDVERAALDDPAGRETAAHAREHGAAVVASVHDFEGTPPVATMRDLLAGAAARGDVGKLAVTATGRDDALALLRATRAATAAGDRVATMAMGAPGRHTRAVAPLYGSRIGYAPVRPADATAPGQYDLATLRDLVSRLSDGGDR